jgi:peptidoglycan/xylan/chitin deacetylase (PgdA/CDA1 family)
VEAESTAARGEAVKRRALGARLISLAKEAVFFIYLYSGYVQLRDLVLALFGRSRAVVLYYHRIGARDVLTRTTEQFRDDLDYVKSKYECLSLHELCEQIRGRKPRRRRAVVITFDDGYRDNFTEAMPVLASAGLTATFFVATGFIGTAREFPHDLRDDRESRFAKLTWDDLRLMEEAGFEVGSHTVNHTNMGRADEMTAEREILDSLAALDRELGARPRPFSFPWGKPEDISPRALEAIRRAGYYAAASAYGGANSCDSDLFNIRRVDVGNGDLSRLALRARIAGLDPDYFRVRVKNFGFRI